MASVSELGVEALDAEWRTGFHGRYFYVLLERDERIAEAELEPANGNAKPSHRHRVQARMISGVEDPATGSAACALAGYLALQQEFSYQGECVALEAGEELREAEWTERFEIVQGVEMGRRSEIGVEVLLAIEMGRQVVRRIRLRGQAVVVMMGSLEV